MFNCSSLFFLFLF